MEYVFGILNEQEVLTTKGDKHSELSGFCAVENKYTGSTVTDNFRIVKRQFSGEDDTGRCYDRYEIDRHYRVIDKTQSVLDELEKTNATLDYLSMMSDIELPTSEDEEGMGDEIL